MKPVMHTHANEVNTNKVFIPVGFSKEFCCCWWAFGDCTWLFCFCGVSELVDVLFDGLLDGDEPPVVFAEAGLRLVTSGIICFLDFYYFISYALFKTNKSKIRKVEF
jgi:hypothetical protein